jgi:HSP20 family protein
MKTVLRTNGNLFPALPSLIEDFFNRDLVDSSVFNWRETGATMPAVNIAETNEDYLIEVAAPGMKRENFKVELDNNVLTIASHIENEREEKNDKSNFTRREFNYQSFQRSFSLPENKVEGEKISAKYSDGILYVTVPKKEEAKVKPARQISIS